MPHTWRKLQGHLVFLATGTFVLALLFCVAEMFLFVHSLLSAPLSFLPLFPCEISDSDHSNLCRCPLDEHLYIDWLLCGRVVHLFQYNIACILVLCDCPMTSTVPLSKTYDSRFNHNGDAVIRARMHRQATLTCSVRGYPRPSFHADQLPLKGGALELVPQYTAREA